MTNELPSTFNLGEHVFKTLEKHTANYHIVLLKSRQNTSRSFFMSTRKNWLFASILNLGLLFGASTDISASDSKPFNIQYSSNILGVFSSNKLRSANLKPSHLNNKKMTVKPNSLPIASDPQLASQIDKILTSRLNAQNTPDYVKSDLKLMAKYYSQFPEAVSLLKSIATKPWTLHFKKNTWETQVIGTRVNINSAKIIFDTRAAAKLRLQPQCDNNPQCISSPADALLHELLHAQTVFLDSDNFLKEGGMNTHFYPTLHEMDIIKSEKKLYKQMEKRDGLKRPQRVKHEGEIQPASCVTCIT